MALGWPVEMPGHGRRKGDEAPMSIKRSSSEDIRVLIVEDEPLVSMLLADLVEDAGFIAAGTAATAHEALRIADSERPAVAIIDVNLRGARDGLKVGADLARRGTSLIFISGHFDVGEWAEVQALGPVAVLPKPCLPAKVIEALVAAARAHSDSTASAK